MLLVNRRRIEALEKAQDILHSAVPMKLSFGLFFGGLHIRSSDLNAGLKLRVGLADRLTNPAMVVVVEEAEEPRKQPVRLATSYQPQVGTVKLSPSIPKAGRRELKTMLLAVGLVATLAGCSQAEPIYIGAPIPKAKRLTCDLKAVSKGLLQPEWKREKADDALAIEITEMDDVNGYALISGSMNGPGTEFKRSTESLRFIQPELHGNVAMLTVYVPPDIDLPMPAVYSRHIQIAPGKVGLAQYAGSCTAHP